MPPRRVIGIDAGGTKLLGGVVDEGLVVHHRVHRTWRGADRAGDARHLRRGRRGGARGGARGRRGGVWHPRARGCGAGASVWSTHLPLDDVPFRDLMSERLGLPVVVDNDANAPLLAEHRFGAARGTRRTPCWSRSAPGSAAACCSTGASTAARAASPRSSATWSSTIDGADCHGRVPGSRLPRGARVRDARSGGRGARPPRRTAGLGARPPARAAGEEITGATRDRAGARRRRAGARGAGGDRPPARAPG